MPVWCGPGAGLGNGGVEVSEVNVAPVLSVCRPGRRRAGRPAAARRGGRFGRRRRDA